MKKFGALALMVLLLNACASIAPLDFSVPNVGPSAHKINAEVKSITVSVASPEEKTGDIIPDASIVAPMWKSALEDSLNKMAIFKDDAPEKVSIVVKILQIEKHTLSTSIDTTARYQIIDRASGSIVYTSDISASGEADFNDDIRAISRLRLSLNRSVQNNLQQFLQQLPSVNLKQPMFPTK